MAIPALDVRALRWRAARHVAPRGKRREESADMGPLCAKGLEAVHLLASSLRVDRSLTTAVRFAARNGSDGVREVFERLEWEVQVRHHPTVDEGFFSLATRVGRQEGALKRALLTLHGAESEPTREGLERRLERALDIVLKADERRRELLSSTLERPVTLLLGTGVVLPLVLVTLIPLLRVAQPAVSPVGMALLMLVAVPALTLLGASRILDRNSLGAPVAARERRWAVKGAAAAVAAGAAGAAFALFLPGALPVEPAQLAAASAAAGAAVAGTLLWRRSAPGASAREEAEADLPDLLHAVGSKMTAGRPAEQALLEAVEAAAGKTLSERLRGVLFDVVVGRRDLRDAIARDDGLRSCGRAAPALRLMASAARRDAAEAGRVVQHLAEFERIRLDAATSLRAKVRSVVETARTTTAVFAPLILGITAGMYGLLSTVPMALATGSRGAPDAGAAGVFSTTVVLYLLVEAVIMGWFAARMVGTEPVATFGKALARDIPIAMVLFLAAHEAAGALF